MQLVKTACYYTLLLFQIHGSKTEQYLLGKNLSTPGVVAEALGTLGSELVPEDTKPGPSVQYKHTVAVALLYKVMYNESSL